MFSVTRVQNRRNLVLGILGNWVVHDVFVDPFSYNCFILETSHRAFAFPFLACGTNVWLDTVDQQNGLMLQTEAPIGRYISLQPDSQLLGESLL